MIRKIFSVLFSIALVTTIIIFILFLSVRKTILTPDFFNSVFAKSNIYTNVIDVVLPAYSNQLFKDFGGAGSMISPDDAVEIIKKSVTPAWLESQIKNITSNIYNYANKKSPSLTIVVPLADIKKSLIDNITSTVNKKIESLPECSESEMKEFQSMASNNSITCKPPGEYLKTFEDSFAKGLTEGDEGMLAKIPDQFDIGVIVTKNPGTALSIQNFYEIFNKVYFYLISIMAFLYVIIFVMNLADISRAIKWISIPTIVGSALILIIALTGNVFSTVFIKGFYASLPVEARSTVDSLGSTAVDHIFGSIETNSLIMLISAIALLIAAIVINKKNNLEPKKKLN